MTPETFAKITAWLYVNHQAFHSTTEWRKAFIEYLQSLVGGQDIEPETEDWTDSIVTARKNRLACVEGEKLVDHKAREKSFDPETCAALLETLMRLSDEKRTIKGKVYRGEEIYRAITDYETFRSMLATMQEPTFFEINEKGQLVMMDGCKEAYGLGEDFETAQRRQTRKSYRKKGEVIMEKGLPTWDEYQRMNTGQFERETSTWTGTMGGSRARQACWQASAGHVDSFVDVCSNRLDTLGSRGVLRVNLDFES